MLNLRFWIEHGNLFFLEIPVSLNMGTSEQEMELGDYDCDVCREKNRMSWFEFVETFHMSGSRVNSWVETDEWPARHIRGNLSCVHLCIQMLKYTDVEVYRCMYIYIYKTCVHHA